MLLRRTLPAVLAVVALAGCPSVDRDDGPPRAAIATFDASTGTIPLPNDLALQRAPGLPPGVQRELLLSFVANGGWPSDQEVPINIPVTVRSRQSDGSYGAATPPEGVDLATATDDAVAFVQTNVTPPVRILRCPTSGTPTATCWEPSYANGLLTLRRNGPGGHRRWDAGGRYVVGLRNTIRTADGLRIEPDQAIALIAPNLSLAAPENQPPGTTPAALVPAEQLRGLYATPRFWTTITDPATCAAAGVPVAPCWLPLPAGAGGTPALPPAFESVSSVFPTAQLASIQTFTVSGATAVRALTDSGSGQVPLPSDFLLDPATGRVRNVPAFGPAAAGLATLDGFSTTAPLLMPLSGPVSAATITPTSALLFEVASGGLVPVVGLKPGVAPAGPPQVLVQPPPTIANGLATAVVLAPAVEVTPTLALPPLKEKTQYLVVLTNDIKDAADQPMRRSTLMDIVFSFSSDICEPAADLANCTSKIPGVSNADAAGLQRLRQSVGPALDQLGLRTCGGSARCAVLAYTVKTQSVKDVTKLLAAAPYGIEQAATQAVFSPAGTAEFSPAPFGLPAPGTPQFAQAFPNVARFVQANVPTVYAIQGSTGAFDPAFATWTPAQVAEHLQQLPVLVAIPKCAAPPCVAPLVVFHHGLNGARYQLLAIADKLASKGFVAAAIDAPYHGDRAYCTSNAQCVTAAGGEGVCTPDPTLQTPSDTTAPGRCGAGETLALDPARLSTVASGNFVVSSNFFRMRDGIRQSALDLSALVLALARPPSAAYPLQPAANDLAAALAAAGIGINPTQVYFSSLSLGGIIGTSAVATNPRFTRAALNVAGGTIVDILTTAPAFADARTALFTSLGLDPAKVSPTLPDGSPNPNFDPAQAARLAQTLAIAKWIVDPADPVNYAANLTTKTYDPALQPFVAGGLGSATTEAYGQLVVGDTVVPNPTNRLLYGLAGIPTTTYDPTQIPAASRHGLLLANFTSPAAPVGEVIREDLASFLATTTAPPATRTIP